MCGCRKATAEELSQKVIRGDQTPKRAPSQIKPYPNVQPTQSPPASVNAQYAAIQERHTNNDNMQHAVQPQPQPMNPIPIFQSLPSEASQGYHQKQSNLLSQFQYPATVESGPSHQQFQPASNFLFNPNCQPVQQNGTPFQSHIPNHNPYQPFSTDENGHNSIATLTQSPGSLVQPRMDLAYPPAINQQTHLEQTGPAYPASQNFGPMHIPAMVPPGDRNTSQKFDPMHIPAAVPPEDRNRWMKVLKCCCGPNCNCLYCTTHPTNRATTQRVLDLTEIMANDSYWDAFPLPSRPQSKTENALTNGTDMNTAMHRTGFGSLPFDQLDSINIPTPTFDEGGSINDRDQFNDVALSQMKDSNYQTVEYFLKEGGDGNCTNATGTCLCCFDCSCQGCQTHQGHVSETPGSSEHSML